VKIDQESAFARVQRGKQLHLLLMGEVEKHERKNRDSKSKGTIPPR
jgi:hypothetical protein